MSTSPFQPGDEVRLLDDPTRTGVVVRAILDPQFGEWMVRVRIGTRACTFPADDLEPCSGPSDPWTDVARGVLGPARQLRTLLTYERLRRPPGPVGSSFGTARARLYPFQFKPLVKFLENPNHTLLIADEVGLGKTIEAGYILREWKLRQDIDTVLIVVPARLRTKWRDELERRFDEHFKVVSAREVRALLRRLRRKAELEPMQWIASYESLRLPDIIEQLQELSPPLDLVILDEAHRVRNRETLQHRLARALADAAHAMLYLTATPVQTSIDDLHTLVDLLQPGSFGSSADFIRLIEANRPIIRGASLAAAGRFDEAAAELFLLSRDPLTRSLFETPVVRQLIEELTDDAPRTRQRRVAMQSAIADLSLTGHLITRTRKAEVIGNRSRRQAQPVLVHLSPNEQRIYELVADVTRLLHPQADSWGRSMAALMAYRYTASCIPAAVDYMRDRLEDAGFRVDTAELGEDIEPELTEDEFVTNERDILRSEAVFDRVQRVLRLRPTPAEDSKLQAFLRAIRSVWADDRRAGRQSRKIIVFSFFKRTLAYLQRQLESLGVASTVIHGGIPILDREERIEAFLSSGHVNVLLSSEVGGEGLDLQRASVVVNYDLPWNPMVVEQRIGRVDRIGQRSPTITILNLVCSDTVEDRILHRLYERVDLFESSIGEMDEILGAREVRELIVTLLKGDLSDAELEERIEQTAQAAIRRRKNAEVLADRVDGLLAADQAILDQINLLIDGNRLPSEKDVADLVHGFLEHDFPGVQLAGDPTTGIAHMDLTPEARTRLERWSDLNQGVARRLVGAFRRGPVRYTVNGEVAMRSPRVEFLQARHPLVQFAVDEMSRKVTDGGAAFGARVHVEGVTSGYWVVGIWSVEVRGGQRQTDLRGAACRIGSNDILVGEDVEALLSAILARTEELDPRPELDPDLVEHAATMVETAFTTSLNAARHQGEALTQRRHVRRRATWEATLQQQVRRAEDHVRRMRDQQARPFAIRMAEAKLAKRRNELKRILEEFDAAPSYSLVPTEVATVLVEVV